MVVASIVGGTDFLDSLEKPIILVPQHGEATAVGLILQGAPSSVWAAGIAIRPGDRDACSALEITKFASDDCEAASTTGVTATMVTLPRNWILRPQTD